MRLASLRVSGDEVLAIVTGDRWLAASARYPWISIEMSTLSETVALRAASNRVRSIVGVTMNAVASCASTIRVVIFTGSIAFFPP